MIQDPGKRKILAAEMARNAEAPDFKGMTFESHGQAFGGVSPPMGTTGPDDFEGNVAIGQQAPVGAAPAQADAQAAVTNAPGGAGVMPDLMKVLGAGSGAMGSGLQGPQPSGLGPEPAKFVSGATNPQVPSVPGPANVDIEALANLLARR